MKYHMCRFRGIGIRGERKEIEKISVKDIGKEEEKARRVRIVEGEIQDIQVLDVFRKAFDGKKENCRRGRGNALGRTGRSEGMIVKCLWIKDIWIDFLIEPEFFVEDYKRKQEIIEVVEEKEVEKGKKFELHQEEIFLNRFECIGIYEIEEKIVKVSEIKRKAYEIAKVDIREFQETQKVAREVFAIPLALKTDAIMIKDIRLKRKSAEAPLIAKKKLILSPCIPLNPLPPSSHKITIIESKSDLQKLNLPSFPPISIQLPHKPSSNLLQTFPEKKDKKSITFSLNPQSKFYSPQEYLTQISQFPLKIFLNISTISINQIIQKIQIEGFYIVALEINSKYMNDMDLILTWQTGVKICKAEILNTQETTFRFLESFQVHIRKFDRVFLFFIRTEQMKLEGIEILENYQTFLLRFEIELIFVVLEEFEKISGIISEYLAVYTKKISDMGKWVYLQERISDIVPNEVNESLNTYCSLIFELLKDLSDHEFLETCNLLGLHPMRLEFLRSLKPL